MKVHTMRTIDLTVSAVFRWIAGAAGVLALLATSAAAQTHTVNLVAAPLSKTITLPNGSTVAVPMWGYAIDANGNGILDEGEAPSVPGPRISVPLGTTMLEIHLANALPEPTSLVIPGQAFQAAPVRRADGRIVSMTAEAAPGSSQVYQFSGVKPGTFLYQSGTHQAKQVQMGLYGAMTLDAAAGEAYTGVAYAHEVLVLYSEIDVALHQSVADGTYGHPELGGPASTIDYKPSLFLVNGDSYANELLTPALDAGAATERTLIRLLNAGLKTHAPTLDNGSLTVVAEDGNAKPYAQTQATLMLAAGKTHDAIWIPASSGVFNLYDRSLNLQADAQGDAGMLAKLKVAAAPSETPGAVTAADDQYNGTEDSPLAVDAASGVLANDTGALSVALVAGVRSGSLTLNADGSFAYTPNPNFFGVDSFTYVASDGTASSAPAQVSIAVGAVADAPSADAIALGLDAKTNVHVKLTGNDPDGDALTFYLTSLPANGTASIIDPLTSVETVLTSTDLNTGAGTGTAIPGAMVIYTPNPGSVPDVLPFSGNDSFQFIVADASSSSAAATVSAIVHPLELTLEQVGNPLTLNVVGTDGTPISAYRWTLEEDRTYDVVPGIADPYTVSVSFHASYMPVRQTGDETTQPIVDPSMRYFVSVLPKAGPYTNGGAKVAAGQTSATITLNASPMPTAQIRVRVFEDVAGLNGMWDTVEPGLAGFEVGIDDAGGRYGMSGGQMFMDAYGNQIGTTYQPCSTPPCDGYEVASYGKGYVLTDADGYALIKNLPPGKFTVKVRPPGGETWIQTSTIEGTPGIDAWVKANEPQYFSEFGPPGPHVEMGFVRATSGAGVLGEGAGPFSSISGRVTNMHMSRPPDPRLYSGAPFDFTRPWVALNAGALGTSLLYAQPVNEDGTFQIDGVPSGSYRLVVFDSALDIIIANKVVNVTAPAPAALGDVPVFHWFTRLYNYVFDDANENGMRDAGEAGIPEQAINIRWRDGSMYQSSATDGSGFVPFEEVFPFFAWLVAEVDYTRFKATGVTVVVDNGGDTTLDAAWPGLVGAELDPQVLAPQPQAENGGAGYRTETGPVLLEAFQGFIGQSNVLLWGKTPYAPVGSIEQDVNVAPFDDFPGAGDVDANGNGAFDVDQFHGGISGIVHYSVTRAENDPRWGTGEPWEAGIPGVRVQLWDEKRTTLLNEVTTDSWDDSQPTGCQGEPFTFLGRITDCYDGLRNFNQVRPGVFDGGYAFYTQKEPFVDEFGQTLPVDARSIERPLAPGKYVVKVIVPNGYGLVKEEDKNVDFGEEYIPQEFYLSGYPLGDPGYTDAPPRVTAEEYPLYAPFCVGTLHEVPAELALFPGVGAAYGGDKRPLCDAKLAYLRAGQNTGVNFFLFTEAPVAGHIVGFVLDDTTNEFDPNAPTFGEKYAPPFMPVAIRDWTGRELLRTYTDAYGVYNVLVPSTWTAAAPIPSGMVPNMLTACINAPTMPGPGGTQIPDPQFHKQYSHFCYTFQYMPGTTTYLDTPVLPTGAFTGNGTFPVDAELPTRTPVIASVTGPLNIGPYIVDQGVLNSASRVVRITSVGSQQVPNPSYDGAGGVQPKLITRDYGFGPSSPGGFVTLGGRRISVTSWTNTQITAIVPANTILDNGWRTGQLLIERCLTPKFGTGAAQNCNDKRTSAVGVTLTVANPTMHLQSPPVVVAAGQKIQPAINAAAPGALVLVAPGNHEEMVVMSKPVRLQGWGAGSTAITVVSTPAENLQAWRDYVGNLVAANPSYLLPDQLNIIGPPPFAEGAIAAGIGGEGAGVQVFAKNQPVLPILGWCIGNEAYCLQNENPGAPPPQWVFRPNARIDGFAISGASQSAAIMVNGFARYLEISNNKIFNNYGVFAGGIRIGHSGAPLPLADEDAMNENVSIHNNLVTQNAGINAAGGGGIVIGTGSRGYSVKNNFIAANFTIGQGAGISHIGLSQGGTIDGNAILFNESFNQGIDRAGGGVFVGGRPPVLNALTPGSGNVQVINNLIQGNAASAGDGAGIALLGVNGQDVQQYNGPVESQLRYRVDVFNNVIANNEAALAGGGISLQDAAYVDIVHNTIVHNDSLATTGTAFDLSPSQSTPQPAGIVSRGHTPGLLAALGGGEAAYADPSIVNSIVWQNRSFYFGQVPGGTPAPGDPTGPQFGLIENASQPYWDLGLLGGPAGSTLAPMSSVLTDATGYDPSNTSTAPAFVQSYFNGDRRHAYVINEPTTLPILAPAAFDEGGNFIRPQFGPLSVQTAAGAFYGNYHVTVGEVGASLSSIYGPGPFVPSALGTDFDGEPRPALTPHKGADQKGSAPAPVTPIP